jgi:hypothetical protein
MDGERSDWSCETAQPGEVLVSRTVVDLVAGSARPSTTAASTNSKAYPPHGDSSRSPPEAAGVPPFKRQRQTGPSTQNGTRSGAGRARTGGAPIGGCRVPAGSGRISAYFWAVLGRSTAVAVHDIREPATKGSPRRMETVVRRVRLISTALAVALTAAVGGDASPHRCWHRRHRARLTLTAHGRDAHRGASRRCRSMTVKHNACPRTAWSQWCHARCESRARR